MRLPLSRRQVSRLMHTTPQRTTLGVTTVCGADSSCGLIGFYSCSTSRRLYAIPALCGKPHSSNKRGRTYSTYFNTSPSTVRINEQPAPHTGTIRIISLNRPFARNAISRQLLHDLSVQIEAIHSEGPHGPTRALIIASEVEECFCAGADLKERKGMTTAETITFLTSLRATFARLATLPIPTIAAVSSLALGGGLELALCTHFRVFASTTAVGLPETRLAIIPGAGGTYRLPAVVGIPAARDLVLTGRRVGGVEALSMRLCDRLVAVADEEAREGEADKAVKARVLRNAKEAVLKEAEMLAVQICEGGPVAIRAALSAVSAPSEAAENKAYEAVVETSDRDEALAAFREKRKPTFKGQ